MYLCFPPVNKHVGIQWGWLVSALAAEGILSSCIRAAEASSASHLQSHPLNHCWPHWKTVWLQAQVEERHILLTLIPTWEQNYSHANSSFTPCFSSIPMVLWYYYIYCVYIKIWGHRNSCMHLHLYKKPQFTKFLTRIHLSTNALGACKTCPHEVQHREMQTPLWTHL